MNPPSRGPMYQPSPSSRKKKLEIFTQNKLVSLKRQPYQESNPYALNRNPSTPFIQRNPSNNDSYRDTLTETSSQKSAKIVRANGLRKAEKPNLAGSKVSDDNQTPRRLQVSNASLKEEKNGFNNRSQTEIPPPHSQNHLYNKDEITPFKASW